MADIKWIKITTDIFDDEKILLIENMPDADAIIVIWFKLLCLAGKQNNSGVFMMNDKIAYTDSMLATIFRRKETTVKMALEIFEQFGMIEIVDGVITIPNWGKHQNLDKIEQKTEYMRNYMREYRDKQKEIACKTNSKSNSKSNVSEADKDKDIDKEKDIPPKSPKAKKTKEPPLTKEQMQSMVAESDLNDRVKEELNIFVQYKIQRGDEYTSIGFSRLINQVKKYCLSHGTNNVIDCMELSMSNNWQGIIWEKIKQTSDAEKFLHGENINKYEQSQEEPIEDDDEEWSDERWEEEFRKRGL